uniref:Pentacotripeptide-repeat region of PRORP domain-containing protein n=1 Tax=Auxenochlorella protothecoides TaxID=3075 RepID=A0A1D2A7G1_AUXPR
MARTEGTGLRRVLQSLQARILSPERTAWYSTSLADNIVPAEALPRLAERIKKNAAYGRSSMVAADLEVYLARGGEIKPAIVSALFNMYARLRSPEKGDALYARVQAHRQGPMTPANYASLLNVYAKAEHPPYGVPRRWAIRAAQVAQEALDAGVVPGLAFMHSLMECQAKAGLPEAALATYHQLLRKGLQPTPRTFNILLLAHRRSGRGHPDAGRLELLPGCVRRGRRHRPRLPRLDLHARRRYRPRPLHGASAGPGLLRPPLPGSRSTGRGPAAADFVARGRASLLQPRRCPLR